MMLKWKYGENNNGKLIVIKVALWKTLVYKNEGKIYMEYFLFGIDLKILASRNILKRSNLVSVA